MAKRLRPDASGKPEDGFTLIEMVVAISVMAIVLVAVAGVLESGLRSLAAAKSRAQANEIATQGIEDLQRFSFNNLGLCFPASGTAPSGLETWAELPNCPADTTTADYEDPCNGEVGIVPRAEYVCRRNNIDYTVKRWVAWSDALLTTKRLAVYVEWDDLTGRHQVSQQSSLRAPDQGAITGLSPPTFAASPNEPRATALPAGDLLIDATGALDTGYSVALTARTTNLNRAVTTGASLASAIPTHTAEEHISINVNGYALFPGYNGFPIKITGASGVESFTVVAGAGTGTWTVSTTGTAAISSGSPITFAGDTVYAQLQTLGSNGSPQTTTVFLDYSSTTGSATNWTATLDSTDGFMFGSGSQYVTFGVLRASDGKTTSSFSTPAIRFCPAAGCSGSLPTITVMDAPTTVSISEAGALNGDIDVKVRTENITAADTVTMSFLTEAGAVTVQLEADPTAAACPGIADAVAGATTCYWVGTISPTSGYRFATGSQHFYFGAAQVNDADPATIDKGSTGVGQTGSLVVFGA